MKKSLTILSVVAFLFIGSYSANSMCVYNRSSVIDLQIAFACGIFCAHNWVLKPCPRSPETSSDCYACCYACGGVLEAEGVSGIPICITTVTDHGWVDITGTCDDLKCKPHK